MSDRDVLKDSLARHRARTKAEKRKSDAVEQGQVSVKRLGNFFRSFGRSRGRNDTQSYQVVSASYHESASEITPSIG